MATKNKMPDTFFFEPWVGVDLDGTMTEYKTWDPGKDSVTIGRDIWPMIARVRGWIGNGVKVKIFTARVTHPDPEVVRETLRLLDEWSLSRFGRVLEVTATKDLGCLEIWDDRAVRVETNSGCRVSGHTKEIYER